ncbi:MAG: hypothetical protein WDO18_03570 [Acidobacteriota bacterium]
MILLVCALALIVLTVAFTFTIRNGDLPSTEPLSPVHHLEERRAAIYENLRDLQFEFRVGKLSDADYQQTKVGLQKELAGVLAEMDRIKPGAGHATAAAPADAAAEAMAEADPLQCPHCGAKFGVPMKFCGQCGKAMS